MRGLYFDVPTSCTEYLLTGSYVCSVLWWQVTGYSLLVYYLVLYNIHKLLSKLVLNCCALGWVIYTRYATSLIAESQAESQSGTESKSETISRTVCTVLCRVLYTRSYLNLIGWFRVTMALGYTLGWIPVGLSTLCVADSLCRTMKWAGAQNLDWW